MMVDGGLEFFLHQPRLIGREPCDQKALFVFENCGGYFDDLRTSLARAINDFRKTLAQCPVGIHLGKPEIRHRRRLESAQRHGQGYFPLAEFFQKLDGVGGCHNQSKIHQGPASSRAKSAPGNLPLNRRAGVLSWEDMRDRPMSVTIFGILNIGFGLLDLLVTLFSMFVLPRMSVAENPILKQMHGNLWTKITTPLDGIAAVFLLAAGVGLLLSKNWARIISIIYGAYAILECLVGGIVTLCSGAPGLTMVFSLFGGVVTAVYPVLIIYFMLRPNVVAALKPEPPTA